MAGNNIKVAAEENKMRHDNNKRQTSFFVGELVLVKERKPTLKKGGKFVWMAKIWSTKNTSTYKFAFLYSLVRWLPFIVESCRLVWMGHRDIWETAKQGTQGGPNPTDLVGTVSSTGWDSRYFKKFRCEENEKLYRELDKQKVY